jgi:hypothetical protein
MAKGFIDRRLENQWDTELEEGLPDCRLRTREKVTMQRGNMTWEAVYCANCGKQDGWLTADWSPHIFCLCNDCAQKMSPPAGFVKLTSDDESLARGDTVPS